MTKLDILREFTELSTRAPSVEAMADEILRLRIKLMEVTLELRGLKK